MDLEDMMDVLLGSYVVQEGSLMENDGLGVERPSLSPC
jgi:hypothetical protein